MGQNDTNGSSCTTVCWLVAVVAGVLVAALLMSMRGYGFMPAAIWGLLTLIVGGFVLNWAFCGNSKAETATTTATPAAKEETTPVAAPLTSNRDATTSANVEDVPAPAAAAASPVEDPAPKVKPTAALAGEADVAARKGEWKYEAEPEAAEAPVVKKKPAAKKAAAPKAKKPAAKTAKSGSTTTSKVATPKAEPKAKAAAKPKPAPKAKAAPKAKSADAKPAAKATAKPKAAPKTKAATAAKPAAKAKPAKAKPVAADGKPELLTQAREGGPDDLKQIKGVGPKLESELHKQGVFHFDQVANWRKKEVEWADNNLDGVKGRVSRDEWVKQAKVLAKGGQTEFSKKVKQGGVY